MADITLAEFNGRVWLVGGEAHLHDLLGNTLSKDVSIELIQCEHPSDIRRLWVQFCGEPETGGMPWQIHPAIVARIHRTTSDHAVYFGQWSAMLDQDAIMSVNAAADRAREAPDAPVELVQYLDPAGPQSMVDLARLRVQLIEDKLNEAGIPRERIARAVRNVSDVPGMTQESQRVDVIVRTD
ncbi:MAG: hypothetical protein KGL52_04490 [Rhodospirillales bacterium]|jgi:hypothetical protein|nr:hypothetical protein [Rhodospirillales bacterium]